MTTTETRELQSVPALLKRNALKFGDKPAFREKEFGIWQTWNWLQVAEEVQAMALGFLALGAFVVGRFRLGAAPEDIAHAAATTGKGAH